ncbi:MAG: hypothetical protein C0179_04930, partial [Fervidicoccus sp.]
MSQTQVQKKISKAITAVNDAIIGLSFKDPVIATFLRNTPVFIVNDKDNIIFMFATAFTDGEAIYVGEDYFSRLDSERQKFVLAHEAYHMILGHPIFMGRIDDYVEKSFRSMGRGVVEFLKVFAPYVFNVVTDAIINDILKKKGLPNPSGTVDLSNPDFSPGVFISSVLPPNILAKLPGFEDFVNKVVVENSSIDATDIILKRIAKVIKDVVKDEDIHVIIEGVRERIRDRVKKSCSKEGGGVPLDDIKPLGSGDKLTEGKEKTNATGAEKRPIPEGAEKDLLDEYRRVVEKNLNDI